ncbi:RNA polymerase sigma-70 factor [Chitinophaga cymbidii]|uniref:DNA-directed RNA polymerase sigma-70 factor n=1 Tax=Chitinophaga cymbidii TaxID=1096750 RepID=A0A512RLF6_9BACT|nr:RNA polymerase sigma-70 factor [Chitinophaga cymbidii]GEP96537.1 DNA-directed RNA polymerase sigma-70 factor [Chitinophaga cymbidii]
MEQTGQTILSIVKFEELFRKHYKLLCLIGKQLVGDLDVAKDLVQEFYIDFWRRREELQLTGSFQSYATRAVKNLCISYLRERDATEAKKDQLKVAGSYDPLLEAELQSDRENLDEKLKASIEKLPAACRDILMLHKFEGLTYAQIAERNQISVNTVKTQIKRAYAFLRDELRNQPLLFIYFIVLYSKGIPIA